MPEREVPDLVADDEVELPLVFARVEQRRIDDDKLSRQELGGERVQPTVRLQKVYLRRLGQPELERRGLDPRVEIGQLALGDANAVALDPREKERMGHEDERQPDRAVDQAHQRHRQRDPREGRERDPDGKERLLLG
jgi:hypothetical protein